MPGILSQAVISQDKIPGISERNMKLFKYLHIFYLLVLSVGAGRATAGRVAAAFGTPHAGSISFSLLTVFTLLRLGLFLSLFLILVVSTFSLLDFLPLLTLLRCVLLLRVPELMRLLLLLLRLVVYTLSLPAGRLLELGRIFTEPKSERRVVWYDLLFRILHEPV